MKKIRLSLLEQNTGQIEGLPANPRQWGQDEIDRLANSLKETPELFEMRPIIAVPFGGKYVILGGNLRYDAAKAAGYQTVPVLILEDLPVEKMREIVLADNGDFGDWDYIALSQDWADLDLAELGIATLAATDYSEKNKEIDPSSFSTDIVLRLRYEEGPAAIVKQALGDNKKETLLNLVGYGS